MDIYEDDIYLPEDSEKGSVDELSYLPEDMIINEPYVKKEPQIKKDPPEQKRVSPRTPGTRVIYQAPEGGEKRKFTGFKDDDSETPLFREETVSVSQRSSRPSQNEVRRSNAVPARRAVVKIESQEKKLSFEEEKKRRYIESLKKAEKAKEERLRRQQALDDSDMEEIDLREKKSTVEKLRIAVIVVAVIAMLSAIGVLVKQYVQQKHVTDWENEVTGLLIDVTEEEETTKPSKPKKDKDTESTTKVLTIEEQWQQLREEYPDVEFPQGLSLKYAKLYAENQDFIGYISIDEFGIGLPVVQSQKDTDKDNYYLRRDFYKDYSVYGCPFVNKNNDMQLLDRNTTIYGHNNNSNILFAPVNEYKTLEGYKRAPVIQFDTIYGNHKWKIIAAFIINTKPQDDNGYVFNYTFLKLQSDTEFMNYINFIKERSLYDTGVDVLPTDKLLTLSTCSHDFDDARFVVVARLVRDGETEDVNTDIAKENESPRYPQAYYSKKKKKNPYKDAENWFYSGS